MGTVGLTPPPGESNYIPYFNEPTIPRGSNPNDEEKETITGTLNRMVSSNSSGLARLDLSQKGVDGENCKKVLIKKERFEEKL